MTKSVFSNVRGFKSLRFFFLTTAVILGCCADARSQSQVADNDLGSKETVLKKETEKSSKSASPQSQMKVTFDESSPGVIFVESNGEKIRIDTNRKTVAQITAPADEKNSDTLKKEETATVENKTEEKEPRVNSADEEESVYDFDEGEEPYDYRIVNVPTPKKVPKGSWNLFFAHRFSQPIHTLSESGKNLLGLDSFSASSF